MNKERIEETVKKEERKRFGHLRKGITIALTTGMIGYTTGRFQEANSHNTYKAKEQMKIAQLAIQGYTFKEDSDPTFYHYQTKLEIDSANKKMQGIMIKKDGTNAGPIRQKGTIGYSIAEKSIQEGEKTIEEIKEQSKDIFRYGREKINELQEKIFHKEERQYQNELQK